MGHRPIKRAVFSFLTAADKGRLLCARPRRRFVLSPAMATSSPSPQHEFETETDESDYDSDATQVPDLAEWPEGWETPSAKRKLEANLELVMNPVDFQVEKYRKMWTQTELETKRLNLQSINEESMWVENHKFRNVVALLEDIKYQKWVADMKKGRV